ncbi:hypothetical protein T08_16118 [Trichinella sp. T8]|nr:hypothetical protein T08_16118 [Trichinella sp. T8]
MLDVNVLRAMAVCHLRKMQIPTNSCPRKLLRWLNSYYYPCDAARSPARVRQIGMAVFNLMQSYSTATSQTNVLLIAIRILAELINGSRNC